MRSVAAVVLLQRRPGRGLLGAKTGQVCNMDHAARCRDTQNVFSNPLCVITPAFSPTQHEATPHLSHSFISKPDVILVTPSSIFIGRLLEPYLDGCLVRTFESSGQFIDGCDGSLIVSRPLLCSQHVQDVIIPMVWTGISMQ